MKLVRLVLKNIGPFCEFTTFDLSTSYEKNLVLIGGKNGSGKTTFLKALKIGLFGPYAFGHKGVNESYINEVESLLNYKVEKNDKAFFAINITFDVVDSFVKRSYEIRRYWRYKNSKLIEKVEIISKGKKLQPDEVFRVTKSLQEKFPPKLIDSALFDGEKIAELIEKGKEDTYLEEIFYAVFNLNYLQKLQLDLHDYITESIKVNIISSDEMKLYSKSVEIKALSKEISSLTHLIMKNKGYYEKKLRVKEILDSSINDYNGLSHEEKNILVSEISQIEKDKVRVINIIKDILDEESIYLFNLKLLGRTKDTIERSRPLNYLEIIEEISSYLENESSLVEPLRKKMLEKVLDIDSFLSSTKNTRDQLNQLLKHFDIEYVSRVKEIIDSYSKLIENEKINKKITRSSQKTELIEKLNDVSIVANELNEIQNEIELLQSFLASKEELLSKEKRTFSELEKIVKKQQNVNASFKTARDIIKVLGESENLLVKKYLSKTEEAASIIFRKVIRKENYVKQILISEKFELSIVNSNGNVFPVNILSAGEKQLLISSIIFAFFKTANREMFFVFDTPLARLDKSNRTLFLNNLMSQISDQVIILSTDSEVDNELYRSAQNRINHTYTLKYDEVENVSKIEESYFTFMETTNE